MYPLLFSYEVNISPLHCVKLCIENAPEIKPRKKFRNLRNILAFKYFVDHAILHEAEHVSLSLFSTVPFNLIDYSPMHSGRRG